MRIQINQVDLEMKQLAKGCDTWCRQGSSYMATIRECDLCMLATNDCTTKHGSLAFPLTALSVSRRAAADVDDARSWSAKGEVIWRLFTGSLNMKGDAYDEISQSMAETCRLIVPTRYDLG